MATPITLTSPSPRKSIVAEIFHLSLFVFPRDNHLQIVRQVMIKILWIVMALAAGSALPMQGGINTRLGKTLASPLHAALISFSIGAAGLFVYCLLTKQPVSWSGLRQLPVGYWAGGILGAIYVTIVILVFPKLGPGLTFSLIVAGQMVVALLLEHFNVLVAQPQPINLGRICGVTLIVAGVMLMKQF